VWALAQDGHSHTATPQQELTPEQKSHASALIKIVRESTERFKNVSVAEAEGYALSIRLRQRARLGGNGASLVNGALVNRGELDPRVRRS